MPRVLLSEHDTNVTPIGGPVRQTLELDAVPQVGHILELAEGVTLRVIDVEWKQQGDGTFLPVLHAERE